MKFNLPLESNRSARLYWELGRRGGYTDGKKCRWPYERLCLEELLCLALLQARFDPRLMGILVHFFQTTVLNLNPVSFRQILAGHKALPIAAVLGEYLKESKAPSSVVDLFDYLSMGTNPVPLQLFYRHLYPLASRKMEDAVSKPLWAFKKWGFLATDPPLLKHGQKRVYLYESAVRRVIARELAQEKGKFRLKDYLTSVGYSVSRQQALKDLSSFPFLRKKGKNKGTVYWGKPQPNVG